MKSDVCLSRRRLLEGCAAALGVSLIGCASQDAAPAVTLAVPQGNGFVIKDATQVEQLENAQALPFEFPDKVSGLLFRTKSGQLGAVNAVCTHAGCIVNWNGTDPKAAFVCPCHGSQFAQNGAVIKGPAEKPLAHYAVSLQGGDAILTPA